MNNKVGRSNHSTPNSKVTWRDRGKSQKSVIIALIHARLTPNPTSLVTHSVDGRLSDVNISSASVCLYTVIVWTRPQKEITSLNPNL